MGQSEKSERATDGSALPPTPDMALHRTNRRFVPRTDIDGTADRSPRIKSVLFDLGAWMAPRPEAEPFEATRQTGVSVVDMEHPRRRGR
jgi:hypothetical protein